MRALCESVAHFTQYAFDDWDWQAIDAALPHTDAERPDGWYDYPPHGPLPVTLHLARDPGTCVVHTRLTGSPDALTTARIQAALHIFATWELT